MYHKSTIFHSSADDEHFLNSSTNSSIMASHVVGMMLTIVLLATRKPQERDWYVSPVVIDDYIWPALNLVK